MRSILCAVFLLECFSVSYCQSNGNPMMGMMNMAGMMNMMNMTGMANMMNMPGMMAMSGMPNMMNMPGMMNMSGMPIMMNMPGMMNMSGMPNMMNMPGMMNMSGMANMMNMTGMMNMSTPNMNMGSRNNNTMTNLNVGNPDEGRIERPCEAYDTDCIRNFFVTHGHCKKAHGPVPDPYMRAQAVLYVPRVNLTISVYNQEVRGLNGRIEDFYINRDTDKVVLVIDFRAISLRSNYTYFRFHRRAKEPVVTTDAAVVTFRSVTVTTMIPNIINMRLDNSVSFAYGGDANPTFSYGPGLATSTDPMVQATVLDLISDLPTTIREFFVTEASFYGPTFIQYNICDYGLNIL